MISRVPVLFSAPALIWSCGLSACRVWVLSGQMIRISIDKKEVQFWDSSMLAYGTVMMEPVPLTGIMSKLVDVARHKYKMRGDEWSTDTFSIVIPC